MLKKVWKVIKYVFFITGIIILGLGISVYIYRDRIVKQLIREANTRINTPITVENITLELIEKFPQVAVSFNNVIIEESWPEKRNPLLVGKKIYAILNPIELIQGSYEINQVYLEDAEVFIRINEDGENNFAIFSKKNDQSSDSLVVDLKKISLNQVRVHYQDANNQQHHRYFTESLSASVKLENGIYHINTQGDLKSEFINIHGRDFAVDKSAIISTDMLYDPSDQKLSISPSQIRIRDSRFEMNGIVVSNNDPFIDLKIDGIDTDIQSLINLLPEDLIKKLRDYNSTGEVYFNMAIEGYTKKAVGIDIMFGLKDAELSHPKLSNNVTNVYLNGKFQASSVSNLNRSNLELSGIKGNFESHPFSGDLKLVDLNDPKAEIEINGTFEVAELLKWMPESRINSGSGLINCQISFNGRINDLKSRYTSQKTETAGEVELENVRLTFNQDFPAPTTINGNFVFSHNDLAINNASILTGNSSWTMNGYLRNILPYLLFDNQYIGIEADINASYIDVAELLPLNISNSSEDLSVGISPHLILDLDCNVNRLVYQRFEARNVSGDLKVKDRRAFAQNIEFHSMGGQLKFSGLVSAANENIVITSTSHWENLAIDSVFYVFHNFKQDWLVDKNLKGNVFADVMTDMTFSPELKFFSDSLVADISISIVDGELNDFEPMIQLEKYVDDENLAHLRFSELRNDIHVEGRKIYLPQMEIRSNVSNILVSGSHTFDQEIDYRVVVPMKTLGRNRDEDMFGAVEETSGGSKLHLKIIGTTADYEIKYDTEGVKNKVVADLKKEVEELKNAFKKKEDQVQEAVLNEEEFFEWEEDTIKHNTPRQNRN